jgi:hypothetical protein
MAADGFDPGALMARYYTLPGGTRVCLRLPRPRDEAGVQRLFWLAGREPDAVATARMLRFDAGRVSIAATALVDGIDQLVGIGAIDRGTRRTPPGAGPELVLTDPALGDGLEQLLTHALLGRAVALERNRAA